MSRAAVARRPRRRAACWLLLGVASVFGCRESAGPAPSRAASQRAELGPHQSPVTVKLLGPERVGAGQSVELTAEVEQFVGSGAVVELRLILPEGARLEAGNATERLPTAAGGKLVRRFVVHLDRVPVGDIEIVASTSGSSFGARARSAYRFGRPEPRFAEPPRAAKPLLVGGKAVGRPIQLGAHGK